MTQHGPVSEAWHRFREDAARWVRPQQIAEPHEVTVPVMLRLLLQNPSLRAMAWYRLATFAKHRGIRGVPSFTQRRLLRLYGLELVPGLDIGGGFYIAHPVGCVLVADSIGRNVTVISAVTFGTRTDNRWPRIGDNTFFGAGCRVLGGISVGSNTLVGANAVVMHDMPADITVVGIPGPSGRIEPGGVLMWSGVRRSVGALIVAPAAVSTAAVVAVSGYLGVLTIAAVTPPARRRPPRQSPATKFLVLVPAHDEEDVIARALEGFRALDYPSELFEVHVVADNCTDGTAAVVAAQGIEVHERSDLTQPGKGAALNWLHDRLVGRGAAFDVVVIVDADTTVGPDFLSRMNDVFRSGTVRAAQGFYGVRDPGTSAAAGIRYATLACRHHLRPLGRSVLGGSCGLYGNGMAFDAELIAGRRWSGNLVEDMEFQIDLLLDGHVVAYVPDAMLAAEMPDSTAAATTQNERWELGRIQLAKRTLPLIAKRALGNLPPSRVAKVDAILDQIVPPLSALVAADLAATALSLLTVASRRRPGRLLLALDLASCGVLVAHVVAGLRFVSAPRSVYRALVAAPRMVLWKLRLLSRVVARPDDVTWSRTARNGETPAA